MPEMHPPADARPPALKAAAGLNRALREAGVGFCHWKSNDHLAEALAGETDIDLFVAPADRPAFEAVMAAQSIVRIISQPWASYPGVEDWLAFDQASGGFLHLHVHYALLTGLKRVKHLHIPWEETLLANLRIDAASGWPIPAAEMELIILLVRIWAKMPPQRRLIGARIPRQIVRELNWLRDGADAARLEALMHELGLDPEIASVVALLKASRLTTGDVIPVARTLYRRLAAHRRMGWWRALGLAIARNARMVVAQAGRLAHLPWQTGKTLPRGGAIIAVIGSDGSGKSTLTGDLLKWLRFKLDVYPVYMGSGDGGSGPFDWLRRTIKASVKPLRRAPADRPSQKPEAKPETHGFLSRLVELHQLPLMRHKIKLLRLSRRLTARGSLIVADRYPQSQVNGISDGPKLQDGRGFDWAARRELPMYEEAARLGPDLLIKLLVDPQTAHRRKPDHDPATIRAQMPNRRPPRLSRLRSGGNRCQPALRRRAAGRQTGHLAPPRRPLTAPACVIVGPDPTTQGPSGMAPQSSPPPSPPVTPGLDPGVHSAGLTTRCSPGGMDGGIKSRHEHHHSSPCELIADKKLAVSNTKGCRHPMPLSTFTCKNAKPAQKSCKVADSGGLYLLVKPNGSRLWRFDCRHGGKRKTAAFGAFPEVPQAARLSSAQRLLPQSASDVAALSKSAQPDKPGAGKPHARFCVGESRMAELLDRDLSRKPNPGPCLQQDIVS